MNIVIYCRISTIDKNNSIENQLKLANEWLEKKVQDGVFDKKDITIEKIIDKGYSGSNMSRPGIIKLLSYINDVSLCKRDNLDMIIVKDISRLGRNYIETGILIKKIIEKRIKLICINQENEDDLCRDVNNLMADFYSKDISIKTKSVLDMNKRNGKYAIGRVPFGYRKNKEDKYYIEIYEPEAKIVRQIYDRYSKGISIKEIVYELNKKKNDKQTQWDYYKVYRILNNEFYKGTMVYGKTMGHIWEGRKRNRIDKGNWKRIENHHKAIV